MRTEIWFSLPFISDKEGRKFQTILENHVQQNDRAYILDFLGNLPKVFMYISETVRLDKEPPK